MSVDSVGCDDGFIRTRPLDVFIAVDIDTSAGLFNNIDTATSLLDKPLEQTFLTWSSVSWMMIGSMVDTVHTEALLSFVIQCQLCHGRHW